MRGAALDRQTSIAAVEEVLQEWLADAHIALVCGSWAHGAMGELFPGGQATLTPAAYGSPFDGVRDLVLDGQRHHLHVDLAQIHRIRYAVAPSVCFGWGPAFEVRLCPQGRPDHPVLTVALTDCYRSGALDRDRVRTFLACALEHRARFGDLVELAIETDPPAVAAGRSAARSTSRPTRGSSHWAAVRDCAHDLGLSPVAAPGRG